MGQTVDPEGSYQLNHLSWPEVRVFLKRDPRLIIPVGTLDHHGPHLPLGANTLITERVALTLSVRLRIVVAPTFHYGLTKPDWTPYPGTSTLRRKTFHRAINELLASWDDHGITEVVVIMAQRHEPHLESLLTAITSTSTIKVVDLMAIEVGDLVEGRPEHERGREMETSLLLYLVSGSRACPHGPSRRLYRPLGLPWKVRSRSGHITPPRLPGCGGAADAGHGREGGSSLRALHHGPRRRAFTRIDSGPMRPYIRNRTRGSGVMQVMRIVSALLLVVGSLPVSTELSAQAVVLDEGTFIVEIDGRTVGTESFRIRRSGFGENAQVIAQGSLELTREGEKQTVESALGTVGVGMSLDAYQVKVSGSGELQVRIQRRGDRLVAETTWEGGVEEREYRRPSSRMSTVLLDRFLAHHYFFLAPYQRPGETRVSIIYPRPGGQAEGVLRMASVESISLGNRTLQAQRLQLVLAGAVHEIWLDSQNRVLRVEIPGEDYVAVRRDPPT